MAYELRNRRVEIPEIDAFLADYEAVCRKHGMRFDVACDYDSGGRLTLARVDGPPAKLDLDESDEFIPCIYGLK